MSRQMTTMARAEQRQRQQMEGQSKERKEKCTKRLHSLFFPRCACSINAQYCTMLHSSTPPKKAKNSRESVFLSPIALSRIAIEKRHTNAFSLNRRMFAQEHEQKEKENHIRPKRTMRAKSEEKKVQAGLATEKGCRNCTDHEREKKSCEKKS